MPCRSADCCLAAVIGYGFGLSGLQAGPTTAGLPLDENDLSAVPPAAFHRGSSLVVGASGPFSIINPIFSSAEGENDAVSLIFESLVIIDENGDPEGLLALSWSYDPDTRQLIFNLRQDHAFRDGRVLNADDVVFTYQCLLSASYDGPMQGRFSSMTGVMRGQSDDEVIFQFDSSVARPDFRLFTVGILKADDYQIPFDRVFEMDDRAITPEGSGAYALQSMTENEIVLALRSGYGSRVKKITILKVNSAEKYSLLQNGDLDIVRNAWDVRMQSRADSLRAYQMIRFSTSVDCYFLVNPELKATNVIQLPSSAWLY
jgi:ABC-type transport system substrate-binding protein